MKIPILLFFVLLKSLSAHSFDEIVLKNISVHGDVPNPGYVELGENKSLTIRKALGLAGFDIKKLEKNQRPYPFRITYEYIAEREPETQLDLTNELPASLSTVVKLGAYIQLLDFQDRAAKLKNMEKRINEDWEGDYSKALERLHLIVHYRCQIAEWKNPKDKVDRTTIQRETLRLLTESSQRILNEHVVSSLHSFTNSMRKEEKYDASYMNAFKSLVTEQLSWISPY